MMGFLAGYVVLASTPLFDIPSTTIKFACEDSDGFDIFTNGIGSYNGKSTTEVCSNGDTMVKERICKPFPFFDITEKEYGKGIIYLLIAGKQEIFKAPCPSGCNDGACIGQCKNGKKDESGKIQWSIIGSDGTVQPIIIEIEEEEDVDCGGPCIPCAKPQACSDPDDTAANPSESYKSQSTVEIPAPDGVLIPVDEGDYCASESKLIEQVCTLYGPDEIEVTCPNGTKCEDGACVPDPLECVDSDGDDIFTKGTTTGKETADSQAATSVTDFCDSPSEVTEWICIPDKNILGNYNPQCPKGILCDGGACIKPLACSDLSAFEFSTAVIPELYNTPEHATAGIIGIKDAHAFVIKRMPAGVNELTIVYGAPFKKYSKPTYFATDSIAFAYANHDAPKQTFALSVNGTPVVLYEKEYKLIQNAAGELVVVITATEGGVGNNQPFSQFVLESSIIPGQKNSYSSSDLGHMEITINEDKNSVTIEVRAYIKGYLLAYQKDTATGKMVLAHLIMRKSMCNDEYCVVTGEFVGNNEIELKNGAQAYGVDIRTADIGRPTDKQGNFEAPAEESALFYKFVPEADNGLKENDQYLPLFGQLVIMPQVDNGKPLTIYFETDEAKVKTPLQWNEINYLGNSKNGIYTNLDVLHGYLSLKYRVQPANIISQGKSGKATGLPPEVIGITDISSHPWYATEDHIILPDINAELPNDKLTVQVPSGAPGCCISGATKCQQNAKYECSADGVWNNVGLC